MEKVNVTFKILNGLNNGHNKYYIFILYNNIQ